MERSLNGLRIIAHIYLLIIHYFLFFNSVFQFNFEQISIPQRHLFHLSVTFSFIIFFVMSGIISGKWFTKQLKSNASILRISILFFWQRLLMIVPITYIYYFTFTMSNLFFFKHSQIKQMIMESLWPNLFFISNYISVGKNVIFHYRIKLISMKISFKI